MRQVQWWGQARTTLGQKSLRCISHSLFTAVLFWGVESDIKEQIMSYVSELSIIATMSASTSWQPLLSKSIFSWFLGYLVISTSRAMLFFCPKFLKMPAVLRAVSCNAGGGKKVNQCNYWILMWDSVCDLFAVVTTTKGHSFIWAAAFIQSYEIWNWSPVLFGNVLWTTLEDAQNVTKLCPALLQLPAGSACVVIA